MKALGNALAPVQLGNAGFAAQVIQRDADFLLG